MFLLTMLMFALSTVYWGTFVAEVTREISDILIKNPAEPLDTKIQANGSWSFSVPGVIGILTSMSIVGFFSRMYLRSDSEAIQCFSQYAIGDLIVVWRAWTLWSQDRKFMIVPMCLSASTLGIFFQLSSDRSRADIYHVAVVITACGLRIRLAYGDVEVIDVIGAGMQQTSWALSLATNMVATSLIAYKAWSVLHPRSLKRSML